ncbi:pathogenesis-related protein 1-like protein, partial [Rhodotorula sp. JG-1b]
PPTTAPTPTPRLAAGPSPTAHLPRWLVQTAEQPTFPWSTSAVLYMIKAGDPVNGAGTTTAWSLVYLFFNGRKALASRRPGPIALSSLVAAQAATYGYYYFGQD